MAYASYQDVIDLHSERLVEAIADRDENDAIDMQSVDTALAGASAEIDARLSIRYQTPLVETPEIVKMAAVEIAVYRLANNGGSLTDDIRKRYEDFITLMKDIAAGKANLGLPELDNGAGEGPADEFRAPVARFGLVSRV